jgi:hypothetical protein
MIDSGALEHAYLHDRMAARAWSVHYDEYGDEFISEGCQDQTRGQGYATLTGVYDLEDGSTVITWAQGPAYRIGGHRGWLLFGPCVDPVLPMVIRA